MMTKKLENMRDELGPHYDGTTCSSTRVQGYCDGFNACADVVHNSPIEHLVNVLNEDEGYAILFKANLALTFADEFFRSHQYKGVHEIANIAALNFMKQLGYTTQEQEK